MLYGILLDNPIVVLLLLVIVLVLWRNRRPPNTPPGPLGLPIIGNLAALSGDPIKATENFRRKYGDVYSLYMGKFLTVFVHGYDNLHEVLVTRGDEFADRPKIYLHDKLFGQKGIVASSGQLWKDERRFALHSLRNFGFGRSSLEGKIQEEVAALLQCIEAKNGDPFESGTMLRTSTANIICSIAFGKRFKHDDPELKSYMRVIDDILEAVGLAGALNFLPWLQYLPGDPFKYHKLLGKMEILDKFVKEVIKSHRSTFDQNDLRDFIDTYIQQINKSQAEEEHTTFNEDQLVRVITDLFIAGTDTTSITLQWAFLYMATYPEIQSKMREELRFIIGKHRLPSLDDRPSLPYTEAVLAEIQRRADIAPFGGPHAASVDTSLSGYSIPKGTVIMTVITSALQDRRIWPEPGVFDPNRFLDCDGKFRRPAEFIPFSIGKRVCLGESLARMELFLIFTAVFQRFQIKRPEGAPSPCLDAIIDSLCKPQPYQLCAILDE